MAPIVILPVQIIPEPFKVQSIIESVLVLQIRPPSFNLPNICHHPLSESKFAVFLFALAVSVELRRPHQEVRRLTFTTRQQTGCPLPSASIPYWRCALNYGRDYPHP